MGVKCKNTELWVLALNDLYAGVNVSGGGGEGNHTAG